MFFLYYVEETNLWCNDYPFLQVQTTSFENQFVDVFLVEIRSSSIIQLFLSLSLCSVSNSDS